MHQEDYLANFNLQSSPSPHFRTKRTSQNIMVNVLIALCLPSLAAMYFFGWQRVLVMITVGITSAMCFEWAYQKLTKQPVRIKDGSAAVTGHLLALSLPTTAPLWTLLLGTAFAIIIVKQIPGGIGQNRFNPAATSRVMQKLFLTPWITNWVLPGPDAISTATPLEYIATLVEKYQPRYQAWATYFLAST